MRKLLVGNLPSLGLKNTRLTELVLLILLLTVLVLYWLAVLNLREVVRGLWLCIELILVCLERLW